MRWAWASTKGGKGGPWPTNVFFNKHSYCKNNPTYYTNHRSSLLRWSTL